MLLRGEHLVAFLVAGSFAAGLNVYATAATLGLLARSGLVSLPPALQPIQSWWVIVPSLAMFVVEFFADKFPGLDLVWNALHTFVRVPAAALMTYAATSHLPPTQQALSTAIAALIALAAHGGKMAVRAAVTPSPEPVSNIALSAGEDAVAIGLTWFATRHPMAAAVVVAFMLVITVAIVRWVVAALRSLFRGAEDRLAGLQN